VIALVTLIWFTIGGFIDLKDFFHDLKTMKRDARDDGRVVGHHNLADEPLPTGPASPVAGSAVPATSIVKETP
jgi:hypothetical protein